MRVHLFDPFLLDQMWLLEHRSWSQFPKQHRPTDTQSEGQFFEDCFLLTQTTDHIPKHRSVKKRLRTPSPRRVTRAHLFFDARVAHVVIALTHAMI